MLTASVHLCVAFDTFTLKVCLCYSFIVILLVCEGYSDLRIALLPNYYNIYPSLYKFTVLMSSKNWEIISKFREIFISNVKKRPEF